MNIVGLITEYNPFHNGHLHHIREAKKKTNADYVVVVMSGNFVQRGTPAFMDKYQRTEMALLAGADLVIELPTVYATASAEYFAFGAVSILHKLGIITHLCFGSECGDIHILWNIASILIHETDDYKELLSSHLKQGNSYPKARMLTLHTLYPHIPVEVLENPNNILGIEYMKALMKLNSNIKPVTITRQVSNYHEETLNNTHTQLDSSLVSNTNSIVNISSATSIRRSLSLDNNIDEISTHIPPFVFHIMKSSFGVNYPILEDDYSLILYYILSKETKESLALYADMNEELANRIMNSSLYCNTISNLSKQLKSKHMTQTRINRSLCHVVLDIKEKDMNEYIQKDLDEADYITYARILGFKKESSHLIRTITDNETIPVITKVADGKEKLSRLEYNMFLKDIQSSHLYNQIVYYKYNTVLKDEYTRGVIRI